MIQCQYANDTLAKIIYAMAEAWNKHKGKAFFLNESMFSQQVKVAEQILKSTRAESGALIILKGPTGAGKTEVFVAPFLYSYVCDEPIAPRMYLVEPMHTLIEQFRDRLDVYVKALDLARELRIGEDHGSITSKTYLYTAPITLTTVDSYVYGFLAKRIETYKHGVAITGRFSMPVGIQTLSYTVFDEAHLIQDEAFIGPRVMSRIIAPLVCSGGIVALSSATLPKELLSKYENEVCRFCDNAAVEKKEISVDASRIASIELIGKSDVSVIVDRVSCNERTLVVVNTVKKAIEVYERIKVKCGSSRVVLLHSLMKIEDRAEKYSNIKKLTMGTEEGYVVVGTQTLEVGLDFDFNVLHTELTPIDALVQRMGRICRGPGKHECGVYIYESESSLPYDAGIVNETRNVISGLSKLDLFDMRSVQKLVDEIYTKTVVERLEERGANLYIDAVDYLSRLHMLSLPPEKEVYVRPSFYVTVALVPSNILTTGADKCLLDDLRLHEIRFSIPIIDEAFAASCTRLITLLEEVLSRGGTVYGIWGVEKRNGRDFARLRDEKEQIKKRLNNPSALCRSLKGDYLVFVLDSGHLLELYSSELGLDVRKLARNEAEGVVTCKKPDVTREPEVKVKRERKRKQKTYKGGS